VNLLDIVLVIIVAASVITGFLAGFARVGIGFIATFAGVIFGFWFYGIPAAWIHDHGVHSEAASNLLGFFLVFLAFSTAGHMIGKLLSKLFKWTGLSWLDRLMGGAFGFVRGGLISVVLVAVLLAFTPKPAPNWMIDSKVLPYAIEASNLCADLAPSAIKDAFKESMRDIRKTWDDQFKKHQKKPADLKKTEV
jgi:membrane protein required for colicin V production